MFNIRLLHAQQLLLNINSVWGQILQGVVNANYWTNAVLLHRVRKKRCHL